LQFYTFNIFQKDTTVHNLPLIFIMKDPWFFVTWDWNWCAEGGGQNIYLTKSLCAKSKKWNNARFLKKYFERWKLMKIKKKKAQVNSLILNFDVIKEVHVFMDLQCSEEIPLRIIIFKYYHRTRSFTLFFAQLYFSLY